MLFYTVYFMNEVTNEPETEKGFCGYGDTLAEATARIIKYYGENAIISLKIEPLEDIIPIDEEFYAMLPQRGE